MEDSNFLLAVFLTCYSYYRSCFWKPVLGKIFSLLLLENTNASSKEYPSSLIKYAMTKLALLDIPALQCTKMIPLAATAALMKSTPSSRWRRRFSTRPLSYTGNSI
eukprot:CAMPEP_0170561826 /NCGR_PEP_ID=MMETSP0211-20121228/57247_1 /TAXON_ID=311385 /ORGANISM="Pseudokeronopsis sp., Strain OXSARD2" /LENGTH=105 /DNA_ID=CAMNT_0010877881 /DNA_START=650 /DNA_END=967 /DNA_ORIENTATION=-